MALRTRYILSLSPSLPPFLPPPHSRRIQASSTSKNWSAMSSTRYCRLHTLCIHLYCYQTLYCSYSLMQACLLMHACTYIQCTYSVHTCTVYIQCTYNVRTVYIQCTYNVRTVYIRTMYVQCTYSVHTVYIQCTYSVHTVYIQCTYNVHTVYIQCTYNVHTVYIQCTYNVRTMYINCTYIQCTCTCVHVAMEELHKPYITLADDRIRDKYMHTYLCT